MKFFDDKEIEIDLAQAQPNVEIMAPPGMEDMTNQLQSMFQNMGGDKRTKRKLKIKDQNEFYRFWRSKNLSKLGIPKKIEDFYKRTNEWHSWKDLLGKQFLFCVKGCLQTHPYLIPRFPLVE